MTDAGADQSTGWIELRVTVPLPPALSVGSGAAPEPGATPTPSVAAAGLELFLEPLTSSCLDVQPLGVLIEGADAPPGEREPPAAGTVRVTLYLAEEHLEDARVLIGARAAELPGASVEIMPLMPGWRDRWKAFFRPIWVGDRLIVAPPWEDVLAVPGRELIVVDPGMAFGTGTHETTQLCLRWLAERLDRLPAERLLDVGCGSAILAITALRLGVGSATGIDIDPMAVDNGRENAERNGVSERLSLSTTPIEAVGMRYPVVVANIMAHILKAIREPLVGAVLPGGALLLSGVLVEQADDVVAAFVELGAQEVKRERQGGWVALELRGPIEPSALTGPLPI